MKNKPGWNGVAGSAQAGMRITAAGRSAAGTARAPAAGAGKVEPAYGLVPGAAIVPGPTGAQHGVAEVLATGVDAARSQPVEGPVSYVAARRIEQNGLVVDRLTILHVDLIAYVFRGSVAITPKLEKRLVDAPRIRQLVLDPEGIYVRTVQNELLLTKLRSVEAMQRRLHPTWFLDLNRGLLVNVRRLNGIDTNLSQVCFHIAGADEWLRVSKRSARALGDKVLLPQRPHTKNGNRG